MQEQEQQQEKQIVKHKSKGRPKGLRKQPDGTWVMMSPDAPKAKSVKHNLKSKKGRSSSNKNKYTEADVNKVFPSSEFTYTEEPTDEELRQLEAEQQEEELDFVDTIVDQNEPCCNNKGFSKALYYVRPIVDDYESALNCRALDNYKPITMAECLRQFAEIDIECSNNFIVTSGIKTFKLSDFVPNCYTSILYQDPNNTTDFGRMLWCVFDKGTKLPVAIVGALRCGQNSKAKITYSIPGGIPKENNFISAEYGIVAFVYTAFKDRLLESEKEKNLPEVAFTDYTWLKRQSSLHPSLINNIWLICNNNCGIFRLQDKPSQLILDTYNEEDIGWNDVFETHAQVGPIELTSAYDEDQQSSSIEDGEEDEDGCYYINPSNDDSDFYDQFIDSPVRSLLRHSDEVFYPGTDKERDAYEGLSDGGFRSRNMGLSDDIDYQQDY